MTANNDWRLQGQRRFLKGITLYWKKWTQTREHWDHDHCEFCGAKFMDSDEPEALLEGYTTDDEYYWICKSCAEDFRETFEWQFSSDS